ncbi:MAG TPA: purine-nucleoside phosphorylase [Candidatus Elarobacter sp.]|nr:purine-nucleoside phosphorylase [Candidatus Elarobacter sp.]
MKPKKLQRAADTLREKAGGEIACAIVLGSGFGAALRDRIDGATVPYRKIEGMPEPTVVGHAGEAHVGTLGGKRVVAFSGRFHLYEGRETAEVIYPVLVAAHAGARTFVLTNAAGGLDPTYRPGDVMLIRDQINVTGASPLLGPELPPGVTMRFTDMADAYAPALRERARVAAFEQGTVLREGVYAGLAGPAYETPAEARYLRTIGADAVGMSTVLETIAARALGRDVLGFSLITNVHGSGAPTSHDEVLEVASRAADDVARLIESIVTAPHGA